VTRPGDEELFDPFELALIHSERPVGILVDADEDLHLVEIRPGVVADGMGPSLVESGLPPLAWCFGLMPRPTRALRSTGWQP
jgi:hypothetical protein